MNTKLLRQLDLTNLFTLLGLLLSLLAAVFAIEGILWFDSLYPLHRPRGCL